MKEEKKNALQSENSTIWYDGIYIQRALPIFTLFSPLKALRH